MKIKDKVYWNNGYCIGSGVVVDMLNETCKIKDDLDGGIIILPSSLLFKTKEELLKSL